MEKEKTISFEDLIIKVRSIYDEEKIDLITAAFEYANELHKGMTRNTKDDFITHPLAVAYILTDLNVDAATIAAALLHEVISCNKTTKEELNKKFGPEITKLVENVTKINKLELNDDSESSAIYLRKILVGLAEDVRVLYIKMADRLHNMRTLWAIKPEKQKQTAIETMQVLIPVIHRLGINSIKSELEELCLKYTKTDIYEDIQNKLNATREEQTEVLEKMKESIANILKEHGLKYEIKSRVKSIYSIYKKLSVGRTWDDIYDILALRIFLDKESDCYLALGLIHANFRSIPKRFKDYIAVPKANMYQSLHTSVYGVDNQIFEIQIRTYEMDEIAEKGIASHWSYKEKGTVKAQFFMEQKLELFRNVIEVNNETKSDVEFAQNVHSDFLSDLIYVYTPKGDVLELPKGATPIDFAYRIHSNVGDQTVAAIVNEKIVPLDHELNDGDVVNIKTNKNSKPSKEWLKTVKTSQAKSKIKAYFYKKDREDYIIRGKDLLEKEIKKRKLSVSDILNEETGKKILKDLKLASMDEVYLSLGSLRYTPTYIIELIHEDKKNVQDILIEKAGAHRLENQDYKSDIIVAGSGDIKVGMAKCCKPVLGDEIIGYITKGQGISVHLKECSNISLNDKRLIEVSWNEFSDKFYLTDIFIETQDNKKNYLTDIITLASQNEIFIDNFSTINKDVYFLYIFTLKIKNVKELNNFINILKSKSFITKVSRSKK